MPLIVEAAAARDEYVADLLGAVFGKKKSKTITGRKAVAKALPQILRAAAANRPQPKPKT